MLQNSFILLSQNLFGFQVLFLLLFFILATQVKDSLQLRSILPILSVLLGYILDKQLAQFLPHIRWEGTGHSL